MNVIRPMLAEREPIGSSRAQVDLMEAALLKAYLGAGQPEEMWALLAARRGCRSPDPYRPTA
jgi:hypothetical protein